MRKVNYDLFKNKITQLKTSLPRTERIRSIRTKPRAPQELQFLIKHALLRKEQALVTKEYERLAPRRWRINAVKHPE